MSEFEGSIRYSRGLAEPEGISRRDAGVLGIVLSGVALAGLAGLKGAEPLNGAADIALTLVSSVGAAACFRSMIDSAPIRARKMADAAKRQQPVRIPGRVYKLDIFNVGRASV